MKRLLGLAGTILCIAHVGAAFAQEELPLWPGKAPGTELWTLPETVTETPRGRNIVNVSQPTLTAYLPEPSKATGTGVILAPGGGLRVLGIDDALIDWLRDQGIATFVLKYRVLQAPLPPPRPKEGAASAVPPVFGGEEMTLQSLLATANANPSPDDAKLTEVLHMAVADAQQALRLVRKNAEKWRVKADKLGFLGISAGGGVAVGTAMAEAGDAYPNFIISLFGPALQDINVPNHAPPLFLAVTQDHWNVTNGLIALFAKWKEAGKPAELHIYDKLSGPIGMVKTDTPVDSWRGLMIEWLITHGFAPRRN
jgi:dienelactone hydrolase